MAPKTKIAVAVAAVLGVAALGLIVLAHKGQAAAAAQDNSANMGGFPNLLFSPSAGPSQISTGGSTQTDTTTGMTSAPDSAASSVMAALTAAQSQITASNSVAYNTNATQLFAALPGALASVGLTDFAATQQQDATGKTSLDVHSTYKQPPAPAPVIVSNPINAAARYLTNNPDVANDSYFGSRPLEHFQKFGQNEGRTWG